MATIQGRHGNFLEDFRPGQLFRHKRGKTVTEGLFAVLTDFSLTSNPLAKNLRYARAYGFRGLVAPPGLVMNVVFSQSVEDVSENGRANLEYLDMRFGVPVYIGDTLEAETLVLGVKASSRDPDRGVVHVQTTGRNQDGQVVLTFQRKVQVWKRDLAAKVADGEEPPRDVPVTLALPDYDPKRDYRALAREIGQAVFPGIPDRRLVAVLPERLRENLSHAHVVLDQEALHCLLPRPRVAALIIAGAA